MKDDSIKSHLIHIFKLKLTESKNHCDFKRAFIPSGWSCVQIETFSKFLAEELLDTYDIIEKKEKEMT